jgi:hypothetical protein
MGNEVLHTFQANDSAPKHKGIAAEISSASQVRAPAAHTSSQQGQQDGKGGWSKENRRGFRIFSPTLLMAS